MYILGISAFYHDSAACLMKDGKIIFATQEERYTRIKHDSNFPTNCIKRALAFENISIEDVDHIAYYEKPFLKLERLINTYGDNSPRGVWSFRSAMKSWLSKKLWVTDTIKKETGFKGDILFTEHHEAHAASAFFASPFKEATVITIDGVGEKATATISVGKGNKLTILEEQHFPHSLGLFYSAITYFCGFKVNAGEYKLMGLAPYGEPKYVELLKKEIITINANGSILLNRKHFNYEVGFKMTKKSFGKLFGKERRDPNLPMDQFYKDLAASAQQITEEAMAKTIVYAKQLTGIDNICLAGGVALNCKANGELIKDHPNIWVQPASGDSGCAVGAAYAIWNNHLKKERLILEDSPLNHAYLGDKYEQEEILTILKEYNINYSIPSHHEGLKIISNKLTQKQVIGWFNGRMEYGPRALGNRSILASPTFEDMKSFVNLKIKKREGFRPFAPIVLAEDANQWFNGIEQSKYMLFTYGSDKQKEIPSCIHEDLTARVQTVNKQENPYVYQLIKTFKEQSNVPVLINTSFNVRGEPIVESPLNALKCLFQTEMDTLYIEGIIIEKEKNLTPPETLTKQQEFDMD